MACRAWDPVEEMSRGEEQVDTREIAREARRPLEANQRPLLICPTLLLSRTSIIGGLALARLARGESTSRRRAELTSTTTSRLFLRSGASRTGSTMATLELQRAHLHPLTFPLTRLDSLSSLELALIQFHLDNDEPGFNDLVHKARTLWLDRRARAPIAARFALPLRPPSPPAPLSVPEDFVPLVEAIRAESNSPKHAPLCANVGSRALKLAPEIYKTGPHANFKALRVAAQKAGIVKFFRSNEGTGGGRDSIRLTSKVRPDLRPLLSASCRDSRSPCSTGTFRCRRPWRSLLGLSPRRRASCRRRPSRRQLSPRPSRL